MPRSKKRRMRRNERLGMVGGLVHRWGPNDTKSTMAERFDTTERRILEALREPFGQIRPLVRDRATIKSIVDRTGMPHDFVAYAVLGQEEGAQEEGDGS